MAALGGKVEHPLFLGRSLQVAGVAGPKLLRSDGKSTSCALQQVQPRAAQSQQHSSFPLLSQQRSARLSGAEGLMKPCAGAHTIAACA